MSAIYFSLVPRSRIAAPVVVAMARRSPAVAILGARQVGKSTLARMAFPEYEHVDLENPTDVERVRRDPAFFLAQHRRIVIDEAQRLPQLFPVLRSHLDGDSRRRVVLLGSASPLPIEIKLGFAVPDTGGLATCMRDLGLTRGFVVNHTSRPYEIQRGIRVCNLRQLLGLLKLA